MSMQNQHLSFNIRPQAPPPPLFATGTVLTKKQKDKPEKAQTEASGNSKSKQLTALVPSLGKLKKKRKRDADEHAQLHEEEAGRGVAAPSGEKKKKKKMMMSGDAIDYPQANEICAATFSSADSSTSTSMSSCAASNNPTAKLASTKSTTPAFAPSSSASSSTGIYSTTPASVVGAEASHLLLLLDVAKGVSVLDLQRHFACCAPLQVKLLGEWIDCAPSSCKSPPPRGAASLALSSDAAVQRALQKEMAAIPLQGGRTATMRVCDLASSAQQQQQQVMDSKMATLEARAIQACGGGGGGLSGGALASFRHVLRCSESEAAHSAVDEFCALAKSGKPKNPPALLLATLLRHRRMHGGELWLGRLNGKPLPQKEKEHLQSLLDSLDWSSMPADGKLRGNMADNSFKLGLSTKAWGKQNGPYAKFAFKDGFGVWDAASVTRKHKQLWEAAGALIKAIDPSYPWTSVQFNRNFRGSRHRDDKDASHQVATAFGAYTGGELRVFGQEGITDVNTRDRFVRFDGRFEHEVLPYEGTRYSVIYFMLAPPFAVDPTSTEEGIGMQ